MSEQQQAVDRAMEDLGMLPLAARERSRISVLVNHERGETMSPEDVRDVMDELFTEGRRQGHLEVARAFRYPDD